MQVNAAIMTLETQDGVHEKLRMVKPFVDVWKLENLNKIKASVSF